MNILKIARAKKGLTQKETAELADVTFANYNRIENGLSKPHAKTALKIAKVLDLDLGELLQALEEK